MRPRFARNTIVLVAAAAIALGGTVALAEIGGQAQLFDTWDENEELVSMADMIDGKPLVLAVGSAS
ncbi:MAG: hypothetical protein JRF63_05415 [Deltaproteobacteria bacterium]|nr:hypothetical protein [Deltaproteobacteria bacterium]